MSISTKKEQICPRPLARRAVEAEPQIDYLKGSDHCPQAHEDAEDQRNCRQHLDEVDNRREQVEVRQDDVVDEVGLKRNGPDLPIISPRSIDTTAAPIWASV
jgi:hypothetical protein